MRFGLDAVDPEVHSPRQQGIDVAALPFFSNPAYAPPDLAALRPDLARGICSEEHHVREGAVGELGRLISGENVELARAAKDALQGRAKSGIERDRFVYEAIERALSLQDADSSTEWTPPDEGEEATNAHAKKAGTQRIPDARLKAREPAQRTPEPESEKAVPRTASEPEAHKRPETNKRKLRLIRLVQIQIALIWFTALIVMLLSAA
jgi:hypothetical protein